MSKTGKYRVIIYSLFACLLIGTISILHTSKVKALEDSYFITLNDGFSGSLYGSFASYWEFETQSIDNSQIREKDSSTYGYLLYNFGSDIPEFKTIFVNLNGYYCNFVDNKLSNEYLFNDGLIFESGFVYQDLYDVTGAQLDTFQLPYKCTPSLHDEYDTQLAYLNLSNNPIKGDGFIYYVVRYKHSYFEDNVEGQTDFMPQFLFTDLDIDWDSQYQYDNGYSNGYDDGLDYGRDVGYDEGYQDALANSSNNLANYNNVLQVAWNGASSFLNTKVFGDMTILHLILIPLTLGVLIIIIKLVRG